MHCTRKITDDLIWVGANDRRLAMFEGVYSVPEGVSYNAYLLLDEKTVLFDTVDKAVTQRLFENLAASLDGRRLDYLIIQHMEPDHSAALQELIIRYPGVKIICNEKTFDFIHQFFDVNMDAQMDAQVVKENDTLNTGKHNLHFLMAPMVHWPEVMVTYDETDKILFSADAFGTFGALNGALFADEVDFYRDYMDEARRYYANIVGKYGTQTQALLKKAATVPIEMICPLHGFVWRRNFTNYINKYHQWSTYQPEEKGVMITYASVYGNTENAAEILACRLSEKGIKTVMFDVSVTPASEIVSAAFKWSHFVFASTTYNAGIFISMEELLSDLVAHNIQNRTIALIENGSWASTSGSLMREKLDGCKNIRIIDQTLSIRSSLKVSQIPELETIAETIAADFVSKPSTTDVDHATMLKIPYGLYVITAQDGQNDNGCIINTVMQITDNPVRIAVAVNKANFTHDMIAKTGVFNLSMLSESAPFSLFEHFGFQSGSTVDKFAYYDHNVRTSNGIRYIPQHVNAVISAKVCDSHDYSTHTVFIANVTQSLIISDEASMTYQYYFDNTKPKPQISPDQKGYVCKICGYVYEGDTLPKDYICPLCKHGAQDFERL